MIELGSECGELLAHVDEEPDEDGGDEDDAAGEEDTAGAHEAPAGAPTGVATSRLARPAARRRHVPVLRALVAAVRQELLYTGFLFSLSVHIGYSADVTASLRASGSLIYQLSLFLARNCHLANIKLLLYFFYI